MINIREYNSPVGTLLLGSLDDKLCLCDWADRRGRTTIDNRLRRLLHTDFCDGESTVIVDAMRELDEYFGGRRRSFDIPLLMAGTAFQQLTWHALLSIPYGATASYAHLAASLGQQKAVRAVANANGANAISIFIPCHRIIGSNNSLTGYAGGLKAKEYLLALERTHLSV